MLSLVNKPDTACSHFIHPPLFFLAFLIESIRTQELLKVNLKIVFTIEEEPKELSVLLNSFCGKYTRTFIYRNSNKSSKRNRKQEFMLYLIGSTKNTEVMAK